MSVAILQLGQCGNQLGQSLLSFLAKEVARASPGHAALATQIFFHESKGKIWANSLLVDMEPKVVERCLAMKGEPFEFKPELAFWQQEGSGNNWAYGYNKHGPKVEEEVLLRANKLLEQLDYCSVFVGLQSLAGGTGSGLGSYLFQCLEDNFPELDLVAVCVAPHLSGEVILQSYNTCFSLGTLNRSCDGVLLIENDAIRDICVKLLHLKKPSLDEMNAVISAQLGSVLFPATEQGMVSSPLDSTSGFGRRQKDTLLSDPRLKLLGIKQVPQLPESAKSFSTESWSSLEKRVVQMTLTDSQQYNVGWHKQCIKVFGSVLCARGTDSLDFQFALDDRLREARTLVLRDRHCFHGQEKSISMLSNSQRFVPLMESMLERTHGMLRERAYSWQYQKQGLAEQDMLELVCEVEQMAADYAE